MSDIIRLLPDAIADQIAAGEVIQRPASVVKELIENAVDAMATDIQVIIKEAGKALIKVVDNGSGMSETDARMSLERHATSKLRTSDDLFAITSMGFRGEALASIAAIAQLEIRTRQEEEEVGTRIVVEASRVKVQEPAECAPGTSIDVKNLFFNVPARRKFLKSDPVEFRHISEEFARVALAHPGIGFSLHHNDIEIYRLSPGNLRQRVVGVIGRKHNEHLVPVSEETSYVVIKGFVGKPDAAKKSRGDQYLFVNNRFIKSPYLHHAIRAAFDEMIASNVHPMYIVYLEIDPAKIDVNVHPTKQQIKFEDERLVYNYLRVSARHALGKYSVTPSLDFDQERAFRPDHGMKPHDPSGLLRPTNLKHWEKLFEGMQSESRKAETMTLQSEVFLEDVDQPSPQGDKRNAPYQLHNTLLISQIKSGALIVDQQAAHERILYERLLKELEMDVPSVQKVLFPLTLDLSGSDASMFKDLLPLINGLGFEVEDFGQNSFVIHGIPAVLESGDEKQILLDMLEKYKSDLDPTLGNKEKVAKALSLSTSTKKGAFLPEEERQMLIDVLFGCENPYTSPSGRKCFVVLELEELLRRFNKD
jgi:DNA mismatch repair protein MutL